MLLESLSSERRHKNVRRQKIRSKRDIVPLKMHSVEKYLNKKYNTILRKSIFLKLAGFTYSITNLIL